MRSTTVSIYRKGGTTQAATGIRVQLDQASVRTQMELRAFYNNHQAVFYKVYTDGWPPTTLQLGDLLVDEWVNNPTTGVPFRLRVVGVPKDFGLSADGYGDHQEAYAEVPVGQ